MEERKPARLAGAIGIPSLGSRHASPHPRDPQLEGRLLFRMSIDATGSVPGVCTEGEGLDDGTRGCIMSVLSSLVFAAPEGGSATVSGSFSFVNANLDPVAAWPWPAIAHAVPR